MKKIKSATVNEVAVIYLDHSLPVLSGHEVNAFFREAIELIGRLTKSLFKYLFHKGRSFRNYIAQANRDAREVHRRIHELREEDYRRNYFYLRSGL